MKANIKAKLKRQLRNDDRGVSEVIGTIMMIGIVATVMPIVMIAMGSTTNQIKKLHRRGYGSNENRYR